MATVIGYFHTLKEAQQTAKGLRQQGYSGVSVDIVDKFNDGRNAERNSPLGPAVLSLSSLVLSSGDSITSPELGPLLAADPMVSGMGGFEEIADANYMLTVVTNEERVDEVRQFIKNNNGDA